MWQAYGLGLLAEAHGHGGHPDAGLAALAEARAVLEATKVRFYEAELGRVDELRLSPHNLSFFCTLA